MAKILFITLGAPGHVRPVLPIVDELRKRGHRVTVVASRGLAPLFEKLSSETFAYDSMIETYHPSIISLPEEAFPVALLREGIAIYPQVLSAIEKQGTPDLIVFDSSTIASKWIARKLGIKTVGYNVAYASTHQCSFYEKSLNDFRRNSSALEMFETEARGFAAENGLPRIEPEDTFYCTEATNLVFMPREFHPQHEALGDDFEFVGPTWENTHRQSEGPTGIVYISLGTLFYRVPEFYRHCIEAFAGSRHSVIITCPDGQWPKAVPENIRFVPFVDSIEMLSRASVFVTHGGMNAVQEAVALKVPMVVVPQYMDQFITAGRIEELGLGGQLPMASLNASSLQTAVASVIGNAICADNLQRMAELGQRAGGRARAVTLIEEAL